MKVLIMGALGNMGRRYEAILKEFYVDILRYDLGLGNENHLIMAADKILIATPTQTHLELIKKIRSLTSVDILCEKPIAKRSIKNESFHNVYMVNNYVFTKSLLDKKDNETLYNYYHSGNDGLYWDCIQLCHLAKGPLRLRNDSPVWYVKLNGKVLSKDDIDWSYLRMIENFLTTKDQLWDWYETQQAHEAVMHAL